MTLILSLSIWQTLILIHFGAIIAALIVLYKREKGLTALLWTVLILFVPFLGSVAYLLSCLFANRQKKQA